MATEHNNFSGFYFVEGDSTYGKIDSSFGLTEDISNYSNDNVQTSFLDIINKFTKPLTMTHNDGVFTQKFMVDNAAFQGTPNDRTALNMADTRWRNIFSIANYIYNQAPENRDRNSINAVLNQAEQDPNVNPANFVGYIPESLSIVKTAAGNRVNKFTFNFRWDTSNVYVFTMYVNPEYFVTEFASDSPGIYVFYTEDRNITQDEQMGYFTQLFNRIGREYMNNYSVLDVPLFSTAPNADRLKFHIFTKSYLIPANPLEDLLILDAVQATIQNQEPQLTANDLIEKYPTIFINESRAIWCLFTDNRTLKNLQISDPLNPGSTIYYNSSPISLNTINQQINESSVLSGGVDVGGFNTYEITTIGNGRWFPIIVAGRNGALTDKIPKYLPLYDDIGNVSSDDTNARTFYQYLDRIVNYILGKNIISENDKTAMGLTETSEYVSFKMAGANWKVYKRGFTTDADQP